MITISHLLKILDESKLSPEDFAKQLGINGMTLRRWREGDTELGLPKIYQSSLIHTIHELICAGRLSTESPHVIKVLATQDPSAYMASLKSLGIPENFANGQLENPDSLLDGLAQMASNDEKVKEVEKKTKKILSFSDKGKEWKNRITFLLKVIRSHKLVRFQKLPAFGALIYLLNIFDLIPDHIIGFGLIDDFFVLGVAMTYYLNHYKRLL